MRNDTTGNTAPSAPSTSDQDVYDSLAAILARFNERVEASRNTDHLEDWQDQTPDHLRESALYSRVRNTTGAEYRVVTSKPITVPLELEYQQVHSGSATLSTLEVVAAHGFYARGPHIELDSAIWNGQSYDETRTRLTLAEAAQLAHSILAVIDAAVATKDAVA